MGNKLRKVPVPKYIKDFNVENRVTNEIEKMEHGMQKMAPRHPSTVEKFKQIEESVKDVDDKPINTTIEERVKSIKIAKHDVSTSSPRELGDKRPSKEREMARWMGLGPEQRKVDVDFEKYGYSSPEKIRSGYLSLRQFDEMLNEIKMSSTPVSVLEKRAQESKINKDDLLVLLEYYKPLYRKSKSKDAQDADQTEVKIDQVFTNVKLEK